MSSRHYTKVCQHGYRHSTCRCAGPKEVIRIDCDNMAHAKNPKRPQATVIPFPAPTIPDDVEEYITGPVSEDRLTKEIWEILFAGLSQLSLNGNDVTEAREWLHKQYGEWEN